MLAFLASPQGVVELPRLSDCTIAVVSGEPSPVLVVTELRELVFQLERPTLKRTGVCVRSMLAF